MKSSPNLFALIEKFEGLSLKPYLCPAKVPTIGFGSTRYANGEAVKMTDPILTKEQCIELLKSTLSLYENCVNKYVKSVINQNQFDACVSFAYNLGCASFSSSTLCRKINDSPGDLAIKTEFLKWNRAGGKVLQGLTNRRNAEADLYFS